MKMHWSSIMAVAALALLSTVAAAQPQTWDKQVNNPGRFKVLGAFGNVAVFDQETGLVWEKSPSTTKTPWSPCAPGAATAHVACDTKVVGNRLGWRLPTIQELASLLVPTQFRPPLPAGHPFVLTADQDIGQFWSATTAATDVDTPNSAWFVDFFVVDPASFVLYGAGDKTTLRYAWCVRSGQGVDPQ